MKITTLSMMIATLFTLLPHLYGAETNSQPNLFVLGRHVITDAIVPESTQVKIQISKLADFINCNIVISEISENKIMQRNTTGGAFAVKEWPLRELKENQVLVYEVERTSRIGISLLGYAVSPDKNIHKRGEFHTVRFPASSDTLILDVKFQEPEF